MDNPRADLNAALVFTRVVELKSFRAAARALGLPKSTVSAKVAQLEDRLGQRLLERTTRSLRLTEAGASYFQRAAPALDALHEAERILDDLKAEPSGRLRVTATVEGGQYLLAPVLSEYARRYPAVELEVLLTDRQVDLIGEGFDFALRAGELADSSLVARKLRLSGGLRLYASPSYLAQRGEPRRPEQLAKHDCLIMSSQSRPAVWRFQSQRKVMEINVRTRARANSFVVLRELAVAGLGIVRMPDYLGADAEAAGTLRPLLDRFAPTVSPLHAVYPSARHLSPKVRALIELLDARLAS
jgi:DNA-binding transcriptional LysR family regulator